MANKFTSKDQVQPLQGASANVSTVETLKPYVLHAKKASGTMVATIKIRSSETSFNATDVCLLKTGNLVRVVGMMGPEDDPDMIVMFSLPQSDKENPTPVDIDLPSSQYVAEFYSKEQYVSGKPRTGQIIKLRNARSHASAKSFHYEGESGAVSFSVSNGQFDVWEMAD
ncbi:hypothetical protein [Pseudomonas xanthosomatis]|uniref:hypothetical protein n=1 Tax=Pseudomonas xanthosomatis TaxID=2842356 RepID=UPI003513B767